MGSSGRAVTLEWFKSGVTWFVCADVTHMPPLLVAPSQPQAKGHGARAHHVSLALAVLLFRDKSVGQRGNCSRAVERDFMYLWPFFLCGGRGRLWKEACLPCDPRTSCQFICKARRTPVIVGGWPGEGEPPGRTVVSLV